MTTEESLKILTVVTIPEAPLRLDTPIETIAKDSLDFIWIVNQIEDRIGGEIPNAEIVKVKTVGDIAALMVAHAA